MLPDCPGLWLEYSTLHSNINVVLVTNVNESEIYMFENSNNYEKLFTYFTSSLHLGFDYKLLDASITTVEQLREIYPEYFI